ncbi:MAG: hypothetical protein JNL82_35195 [Myxococcales bacterium]|nr:hypothetical protein [Myxococcales bacterium]
MRLRELSAAAALVALASAAPACRTAAPPAGPPEPAALAPVTAPTVAPAAKPDGIDQPRAAALTRKIMEAVARARALPITGEVQVEVRRRSEIRELAKTSMYEHNTAEQIRLFTRIEASMGVLPLGADGEKVLLDMLETGVMGVYEPKIKTLLIGTHVAESMLDMVVGHEIAHGLQDMHFDLKRLQQPIRGDSDAESARTYLVEGDAQAAYLAWVAGDRGLGSIDDAVFLATGNQALDLADFADHPVLARSLQLPYADGAATVARLVRERGWSAVDALYKELPTTTEQMLHLDKLLAREPAVHVTIDDAAVAARLPGHRVVWQDNVGEASFLAMLADVEPAPVARAAAAGWGGDRYLALDTVPPGPAPLIVGQVVFDSEADAAEFEPIFRAYLEKKLPTTHLLERRKAGLLYATQLHDEPTRAAVAAAWPAFTAGAPQRPARAAK